MSERKEKEWVRGKPREMVWKDDHESETILYVCSCGQIHSPRIYGCRADVAKQTALTAAIDCAACKEPAVIEEKDARERKARRIAKATTVTNLQHCFSDDGGDSFYPDPQEARDAGETGVFGATFVPYSLDIANVETSILEDHHDDASIDELAGYDALCDAIDAFNAIQTGGSYQMDDKEWQKIPQEQTFAMIKPDATARGIEAAMKQTITEAGFRIVEERRRTLARSEAEWLYREHREKTHFPDLVDYTISGDVVLLKLEGDMDNVPAAFRELMGPTDRTKAGQGTLRALYAIGLRENSIHGSDSPSAAIDEMLMLLK